MVRLDKMPDSFSKQVAWQRELYQNTNERKVKKEKRDLQGEKRKREIDRLKQGGSEQAKFATKAVTRPYSVWKYAGRGSGDGWYAVAFIFSILGDLVTFVLGLVEGVAAGVPIAGWLAEVFLQKMDWALVWICIVFVGMAYLFAGHFKNTAAARLHIRFLTWVGFDIMELLPVVNFLPGFTASFLINYWLVLYSRAIEAEEEERKVKLNRKIQMAGGLIRR